MQLSYHRNLQTVNWQPASWWAEIFTGTKQYSNILFSPSPTGPQGHEGSSSWLLTQLERDALKSCSSNSTSESSCTQKCHLQGKGGVGWMDLYRLEYAGLTRDLIQDYFPLINTILLFWNLTLQQKFPLRKLLPVNVLILIFKYNPLKCFNIFPSYHFSKQILYPMYNCSIIL